MSDGLCDNDCRDACCRPDLAARGIGEQGDVDAIPTVPELVAALRRARTMCAGEHAYRVRLENRIVAVRKAGSDSKLILKGENARLAARVKALEAELAAAYRSVAGHG